MVINDIVSLINSELAGEMLTYTALKLHMDAVIDDINSELGACFPAFSELDTSLTEYTAIPDNYIRSVIAVGSARYFYLTDEEGLESAPALVQRYQRNLYYMKRDWFNNVPEEYIRSTETGLQFESELNDGERGITLESNIFNP